MKQQSLALNQITDPHLPPPLPTEPLLDRPSVFETAKDGWNRELTGVVRRAQNFDWEGARIRLEEYVAAGLGRGLQGAREGADKAAPVIVDAADSARRGVEQLSEQAVEAGKRAAGQAGKGLRQSLDRASAKGTEAVKEINEAAQPQMMGNVGTLNDVVTRGDGTQAELRSQSIKEGAMQAIDAGKVALTQTRAKIEEGVKKAEEKAKELNAKSESVESRRKMANVGTLNDIVMKGEGTQSELKEERMLEGAKNLGERVKAAIVPEGTQAEIAMERAQLKA